MSFEKMTSKLFSMAEKDRLEIQEACLCLAELPESHRRPVLQEINISHKTYTEEAVRRAWLDEPI